MDSNDEVQVAPKKVESRSKKPEPMNEDRHVEDTDHELVESSKAPIAETRKRLAWSEKTQKEIEGHTVARGTFREIKKPKK